MAITGTHALAYTNHAEKVRAFMRDVLGWHHVDAGHGWLIFRLPPAEIGVHPTDDATDEMRFELYLTCDDLDATIAELASKGVEMAKPTMDVEWGRVTAIRMPGGGELGLYQPKHPTAY
jgi:predicted enzyme related to lactoylglutathione lyase